MRSILLGLVLLCAHCHVASAAPCTAASTQHRVPLLELYTSEGCDSCPPTDRWVSELRARGYDEERVVVLAFHVDYWDQLGWTDRFGQRRFSERQRLVNNRNGAGFVYTPQLVLNGKDYRRGGRDDFAARLAGLARAKANAEIRLSVTPLEDKLTVSATWSSPLEKNAQGWLALYENRLATDVSAGENRNKRLQHNFVVRDIAGPFPSGNFAYAFAVNPRWKRADLVVASFVQGARSGDVLQALTVSACAARAVSGTSPHRLRF